MRRLLGFLGLFFGFSGVLAAEADMIEVHDPYVRRVPSVAKTTAAYMVVKNLSEQEVSIIAARSPAAKTVELHATRNEGGLLRMRAVPRFVIPPRGSLVIEPGGLHFMLIDLVKPLAANETVALVLEMADGSRKEVYAVAR
ncbi:MAG: copper chaperone PCu(A)C [Rhodocyclaceae bacterium]|nr:copper chaperone PCu(A)C [Rhodocyclaceae bacterium]